jgi:hypothetical protein
VDSRELFLGPHPAKKGRKPLCFWSPRTAGGCTPRCTRPTAGRVSFATRRWGPSSGSTPQSALILQSWRSAFQAETLVGRTKTSSAGSSGIETASLDQGRPTKQQGQRGPERPNDRPTQPHARSPSPWWINHQLAKTAHRSAAFEPRFRGIGRNDRGRAKSRLNVRSLGLRSKAQLTH